MSPTYFEVRLPQKSLLRRLAVSLVLVLVALWLIYPGSGEVKTGRAVVGGVILVSGLLLTVATLRHKLIVTDRHVELTRLGTKRIEYDKVKLIFMKQMDTMVLNTGTDRIAVHEYKPVQNELLRTVVRSLATRDLAFQGDRTAIREYFGKEADLAPDLESFIKEKEAVRRILQMMVSDANLKQMGANWPPEHLRSGFLRGMFEGIEFEWEHLPKVKIRGGQIDKSSYGYSKWYEIQIDMQVALAVLKYDAAETQLEEIYDAARQAGDLSLETVEEVAHKAYQQVMMQSKPS